MHRRSSLPAGLLLAGLGLAPAYAQSPQIAVSQAWSRATPPHGSTGALYLTLISPSGDKLVGVTTPAADMAELHQTQAGAGDVMQMRPVDGLDLPAGKPVELRPGGFHIMLMGLKAPLKAGGSVPVHLVFQTAPPVDVVARVGSAGASGPAH